jgi:uncharacterized protein YdeI (YjbR/CyaY-like superfamily)
MDKEFHKNIPAYYAKSRAAWRKWLEKHHAITNNIFLIIYKKSSAIPSVYYPEAVEEAICFGWIDSKINKRDEISFYQYFSKRNPKSNWSKVNKTIVEKLQRENLITAGLLAIEHAKKSGTWDALNEIEAIKLPADLLELLDKNTTAKYNFNAFSRSAKRGILEWIQNAKPPQTRQKRIVETVAKAALNVKVNF